MVNKHKKRQAGLWNAFKTAASVMTWSKFEEGVHRIVTEKSPRLVLAREKQLPAGNASQFIKVSIKTLLGFSLEIHFSCRIAFVWMIMKGLIIIYNMHLLARPVVRVITNSELVLTFSTMDTKYQMGVQNVVMHTLSFI